MRLLFLGFAAMVALAGCSTSGGALVVTSYDGKTNQTSKTIYSKSFDGADWVVVDRLGLSVVVDSAAPKTTGDDSFADCSVVVYFWNLSQQSYKIKSVSVKLNDEEVNKVGNVTVGAGPNTRTPVNIGQGSVFVYGISTIADVTIDMDGQVIRKQIRAVRRTEEEIRRYWGTTSSVPPYPWFSSKAAASAKADNISR